nr:TetR/AcrR family transcriptional regulator [Rhodococcus wratislaviensis]
MAEKSAGTAPSDTTDTTSSRGGRPRDPALDDAIIEATRRRLVLDGYSQMSMGDIASDAGVTRPTIYRRWPGKFELVVDALDYGFRAQRASYPGLELEKLPPFDAFVEAVRRVDPCYFNPDAMVLMGNFMGEKLRTPALLEIVREHAVEPRVNLVERVLQNLRDRKAVRADVDTHTVATLCFGAYYAAFLRGDTDTADLAHRVASTIWSGIAAS